MLQFIATKIQTFDTICSIFEEIIIKKMKNSIIHCDLDTFFVSVERLLNTQLIGKPVLIGGESGRSVVASCSYEARQYGIHSAMPMQLARRLCPDAIIVNGDFDKYSYYSDMVTEILEDETPVVEKASIDEHYIDVTGMDKFFGTWKFTQELRQKIMRESGLPISFGLSINKTVSKIATGEAKPCGAQKVDFGKEKGFLAPLSIRKIPGIGPKTYTQLRNMGVGKIATLQEMPQNMLVRVLGKTGSQIWEKANGLDSSPVLPFVRQKSMSKEHTFEEDTIDLILLKSTLFTLIEKLSYDLRMQGQLTSCIAVKLRYSNFDTFSSQAKITYTSSTKVLEKKAWELFEKLYKKRIRIRLIGIKFSNLIQGAYQIDLFEDTEKDLHLMQAMDNIRSKYGFHSLKRGFSL